jgi:hypothetical protein
MSRIAARCLSTALIAAGVLALGGCATRFDAAGNRYYATFPNLGSIGWDDRLGYPRQPLQVYGLGAGLKAVPDGLPPRTRSPFADNPFFDDTTPWINKWWPWSTSQDAADPLRATATGPQRLMGDNPVRVAHQLPASDTNPSAGARAGDRILVVLR